MNQDSLFIHTENWFYAHLEAIGDRRTLDFGEAQHIRKVLRLKPGDAIYVSNGSGKLFLCELCARGSDLEVSALELTRQDFQTPCLNLVLCLLKGRDMEIPVEAVCQLPISDIQLVLSDQTQEFRDQGFAKLMDRLESKSLAAQKQAKKTWLTHIHAPLDLREWRKRHKEESLILVHPGQDKLPTPGTSPLHILVGPEGGFSDSELQWLLEEEGCFQLGLGKNRIRGMHAPLLACGKLMGIGLI